MAAKGKFVVATTAHRGVFSGYLSPDQDINSKTLTLTEVRMAVYWNCDAKGIMGLAITGPNNRSRITKPVKSVVLQEVTSVMETATEAVKAWKAEPWS